MNKEQIIENIVNNSFLSNNHKSEYKANFRDLPHVWDFVETMPINTMEKNDLYSLQNDLYSGERYFVNVEEDNMSIKSWSIEKCPYNKRK